MLLKTPRVLTCDFPGWPSELLNAANVFFLFVTPSPPPHSPLVCRIILWHKINFCPNDCATVAKVTVELELTPFSHPSPVFYFTRQNKYSVLQSAF